MSTIMVIEESAICREPIEAVLKREGYTTIAAPDGGLALAMLSKTVPDLVLMDLHLPMVDGMEVLKQMRASARLRGVPVIVLTARADREQVISAAKYKVGGYMLKGNFSLKQLLGMIHGQLSPSAADDGAVGKPGAKGPAPANGAAASAATAAPSPAKTPARAAAVAGGTASPGAPDPVEALRSIKPLATRSEIQERVEKFGELGALSPTVSQILKLTGNSRCSIDAVAKAISQDHAIALKILKLANSVVYTRGEPIDSVQKAVVRIGLERIRQAVLNVSVVDHFAGEGLGEHLSMAQFWEHSIACGIIAAELAHSTSPAEADQSFTMGLLHDIGRVVYAQQLGGDYVKVLEESKRLGLPLEQVESRMLLMDHAAIMDRVLRLWNFPTDLINPIVFHHLSAGNARATAPHQVEQVLRLGLANRLAHAMMLGSSGNEAVYPTEEICAALGIGGDVIGRIESIARDQTDEIKLALLSHGSGESWQPQRERYRKEIGAPMRPLYVSENAPGDAYRIFCQQLATNDGEAPNVAVVHVASARERTSVANRLRVAEDGAGVNGLPMIVLSPGGKLGLDLGRDERQVVAVPTPFTVPRFVAAVRGVLAASQG